MAHVEIQGPNGPEQVHLLREEDPIKAMEITNQINEWKRQRKEAWAPIIGILKWAAWIAGCTAVSFALGSDYFTPKKPWPDWLAGLAVLAFLAFFSYVIHLERNQK